MNKCPKCNNEKLREGQNFCQVCGVKLNMSKEDAIVTLKRLVDIKGIILPNEKQALEYAIKELERTAQEVPVQEQCVILKIDGSEIGKIALNQIRELQKKSNITIIPV